MGKRAVANKSAAKTQRIATYIQKSFKDTNKDNETFANMAISANALSAAELLIDHFVDILAYNSELCCKYANNGTLKHKHVEAAAKVAMCGRLASTSIKAGNVAVATFHGSAVSA